MDNQNNRTNPKLNTSGVDMSKVDLEEQALDKEAYNKWKKMIELPQLKNREFFASDGRVVKIGTPIGTLKKMIEGLPEEEFNKIIKKKELYTDLLLKANLLKNRAFGLHRVKKGQPNRINLIFEAKRLEMIELFGRMFSAQEVHQICVEDWGIPVGIEHIIKFRTEYGNIIEEKIKAHKESYSDIRLGVKRSRLEEYCWIYGKTKDKYNQLGSREDAKVMITILDKIKDETEGNNLNVNLQGQIDVEVTVNQHIQKEVMKGLGLRQLIVGRVAAKMKADPAFLITRLNQSYYAKFAAGDEGDIEDIPYEEVKYPTKEPYDFDNIKKLNENLMRTTEKDLAERKAAAYQKAAGVKELGVKNALLGMIRAEKAKVESVKSTAEALDLNRSLDADSKLTTKEKLHKLLGKK